MKKAYKCDTELLQYTSASLVPIYCISPNFLQVSEAFLRLIILQKCATLSLLSTAEQSDHCTVFETHTSDRMLKHWTRCLKELPKVQKNCLKCLQGQIFK